MSFSEALKRVLEYEGAYSSHPRDKGGETYKGISRKYHPEWRGWNIIDIAKKKDGLKALQRGDISEVLGESWQKKLENFVSIFYKKEFWDKTNCDEVDNISEELGLYLFDSAVLLGRSKAVKLLQEAINEVIVEHLFSIDTLLVDGYFGSKTLSAVKNLSKYADEIIDKFAKLRVLKHVSTVKHYPRQIVFLEGWIKRALRA